MGELLEIQWLAGEPYLVVSNEDTDWDMKVIKKLSEEEFKQLDMLDSKHSGEVNELLTKLKEESETWPS